MERRAAGYPTSTAKETQIGAAKPLDGRFQIQTHTACMFPGDRLQKPRLPCFAPLYPEAVSPQSGIISNQRLGIIIPDPFERLRDIG
jgi:hypothetical protein